MAMYHPNWGGDACPSCSYWADNFNGTICYLNARDVSMVAISKARIEQIEAYRRRMGWSFEWLSSHDNSFNRDLGVGFTSEEMEEGKGYYNYTEAHHLAREELPGMSVFAKDDGAVFHTYSSYARGIDMLNGAYHYLVFSGASPPLQWAMTRIQLPVGGLVDLVDRADVGVVQRRGGLGFLEEPLFGGVVSRQTRGQQLDRDRALEAGIGGLVDHTHPAAADEGGHVVVAKSGADVQGHIVLDYNAATSERCPALGLKTLIAIRGLKSVVGDASKLLTSKKARQTSSSREARFCTRPMYQLTIGNPGGFFPVTPSFARSAKAATLQAMSTT